MKFLDLPNEILTKIMDYLPVRDKVCTFAWLNRRCAYLVRDAYVLGHFKCTDEEFEWYSEFALFMCDLETNSM
jgi:hypothetical protein